MRRTVTADYRTIEPGGLGMSPAAAIVSRRAFLVAGAAGLGTPVLPTVAPGCAEPSAAGSFYDLRDFHVHLDNSTIDKVLELSRERQVTFGIVEHAGTKENKYPVVLSSDEELGRYLAMLAGKPVYRGVQAEWLDWYTVFSPPALARLDFVLMDAMTYPGKDGQRVKLWEPNVAARVEMADKQAFMDRFVDFHVALIEKQPMDIFGNVSWLPAPLAGDYDAYWTPARIRKVVAAAAKHQVALEISSSLRLPNRRFLELAKAGGVKFAFGSNGRYPNMGKLDYSVRMAQELRLTKDDLFAPAPDGQKAVQRKLRG
jgi:histidinol phosphatase-like PHP family hydrolase